MDDMADTSDGTPISAIDLLNLKVKFYEAVVKHSEVESSMWEGCLDIQSVRELQKVRVASDMLHQMRTAAKCYAPSSKHEANIAEAAKYHGVTVTRDTVNGNHPQQVA